MLPRLLRYLTIVELVVLVLTGAGLFFLPEQAADAWPWTLAPFTVRFLGAVYLAALVAVATMLLVGRWSPARVTLWALFGFTGVVLAISLLELDRFDFSRPVTWGWFALYFVLPANAAYHLWRYRGIELPAPVRIGPLWRGLLFGSAALFGIYSAGLIVFPATFAGFWPWPVDDFHARIYSAPFVSVAAGLFLVARAPRPVEFLSVGLTHAALGLLAIAGLLIVDGPRDLLDWSSAGIWLWVGGFAGLLALSLAMIAYAHPVIERLPVPAPGPDRAGLIARGFAMLFAVAFVTAGITGFLPVFTSNPPADAHQIEVTAAYGYLLGIYPVNVLHNLLHLAFGIGALAALAGHISIRRYARTVAVTLGVLTVMGLVPGLQTTFGLAPLFGHDVWLHALEALAAGYVGFVVLATPRRTSVTSQAMSRA